LIDIGETREVQSHTEILRETRESDTISAASLPVPDCGKVIAVVGVTIITVVFTSDRESRRREFRSSESGKISAESSSTTSAIIKLIVNNDERDSGCGSSSGVRLSYGTLLVDIKYRGFRDFISSVGARFVSVIVIIMSGDGSRAKERIDTDRARTPRGFVAAVIRELRAINASIISIALASSRIASTLEGAEVGARRLAGRSITTGVGSIFLALIIRSISGFISGVNISSDANVEVALSGERSGDGEASSTVTNGLSKRLKSGILNGAIEASDGSSVSFGGEITVSSDVDAGEVDIVIVGVAIEVTANTRDTSECPIGSTEPEGAFLSASMSDDLHLVRLRYIDIVYDLMVIIITNNGDSRRELEVVVILYTTINAHTGVTAVDKVQIEHDGISADLEGDASERHSSSG